MADTQLKKALMEFTDSKGQKTYTVQFNPAQLSFSAALREEGQQEAGKKEKKNFQVNDRKPPSPVISETMEVMDVTMSVKLVVDQSLNQADSVQAEAEGFLAAAKKPDLKEAAFQWNKLHFSGGLEGVAVEYTMFHPDGTPARANIKFEIRNRGNREQGSLYRKEYEALFKRSP